MGFAERYGYKPVRLEIQTEDLDESTRVDLWNLVYATVLSNSRPYGLTGAWLTWSNLIWAKAIGGRLDQAPRSWEDLAEVLRKRIMGSPWFDTLDLLEAMVTYWPAGAARELQRYKMGFNAVAERQMLGCRIVGGEILKISEPEQIQAIEAAQEAAAKVPAAPQHLQAAVRMLADRRAPDYRNSIKESISAVEAVVRHVSGDEKATLGVALKKVPDLHPALKEGWSKLYGYTSDADGIRHAATDDGKDVDQALALYFLTSCSAFVTYLLSEVPKA